MDFALSTEQNLLVDSLRAFIEQELYPYEQEVDRSGEVTPELAAVTVGMRVAAHPPRRSGRGR